MLLHAAIGVLFVVSLEFGSKAIRQPQPEVNVIEAVAVDESKIQYELDKIKKAEQRKKDEEDRRQRELESDAQRAKRLREAEEQHIAELKKKKELEKQSLSQLEKKKKADTELAVKEQEHIKKMKKDSEDLALKNKQEQLEVQKLETKRKMEEEQAADRARQEALKKKQESERAAKDKEAKKVVADFKSQITAKVESVWIKPTNFAPGTQCTVSVKLIPTGDVVDSKLSSCNGDDIFSRSVEAAVQKASPLPVPKDDPDAFNLMREINFVFKPQ
ncbi:MAG: cell envelope integrity protein TolA [Gammaproteobacteria bacterium]|nr:cell envelope integrity protein TolA [Gammaproteobacteria bacterium]